MAKIGYNNAKSVKTGYMSFELNCSYHSYVSFEKDTNPCSQSKSINKLLAELQNLRTIYQKKLHHAQELQNQAYNKGV